MQRTWIGVACSLALLAGAASLPAEAQRAAAPPASNYEGLTQIPGTRFDSVWVAPDVDFRTFKRIKLDPTEVAFRRNWQRDFNATTRGVSGRVTDRDAAQMLDTMQTGFQDEFTTAFRNAGFGIATEAAPDVMRVQTALMNIEVTAPDRQAAGRRNAVSNRNDFRQVFRGWANASLQGLQALRARGPVAPSPAPPR